MIYRRLLAKASDIMTMNIVAARANTNAREIGTKLLIGNLNGIPVVDNNIKLIGIVTAVDIFQAIKQGKNVDSLRAIDIMTKYPVTVKQNTDINEVIDIILQRHIILVPVDDKHKLIGLVGRPDYEISALRVMKLSLDKVHALTMSYR